MAADQEETYGINAAQAMSELDKLIQKHTDLGVSMDNVTAASLRFNAAGVIIGGTFSGLIDKTTKFSGSVIEAEGNIRLATLGIKKMDDSAQKAAESAKKMADAYKDAKDILDETLAEQAEHIRQSIDYQLKLNAAVRAERDSDQVGRLRAAVEYREKMTSAIKKQQDEISSLIVKMEDEAALDADDRIKRAVDYHDKLSAAIRREKVEREQNTRATQYEQSVKERNASAAGASIGSGNFSFTSLGRAAHSPGAGLAANFAVGAGAGLIAAGADSFVRSIEEGTKRSVDFELQVARIQAVTKDASSSSERWSDSLLKLSSRYNVPGLEVAKAAYEGVSKGTLKASTDTRVLEESLKLARATGAEAKDAMVALNDVMSTYGKSTDDAAKMSELLFQATKEGGLGVQELGTTLGRVTSIAAPMGVSVKEIIAALEVMKSKGIAAGNGVAGLSQLLVELEKPSKLTKEALTQLGFASGQSAIATLGMLGAFRAVSDQVQKNGHDIAELFPNIRALRTDLILTSEAGNQYEQNLKKLGKATTDLSKANELAAGAPGQKWLKFVNEWDVATQGLGKHWLEVKDAIAGAMSVRTPEEAQSQGMAKLDSEAKEKAKERAIAEAIKNGKVDQDLTDQMLRTAFTPGMSGVAPAPGISGSAIAQNNLTQETIEAQVDSIQELFHKQLLDLQKKNIGQNALFKEELKAVQENREAYVEELKKKVEATRDAAEKMSTSFDEGKLARALKRIDLNQNAKPLSSTQRLAAEDELRQKRIDELKDTLSQKLTHFDAQQGKSFTESKDPAEIERIQQEILKIEETRAAVATEHAKTARQRDNIEEEFVKKQQEQLDVALQLEEVYKRHAKHAEDMLKIDDKQRNALGTLGSAPNAENFAEFSRSLAFISGQGGTSGDSTQRAMSQDMAQRLARIPGMENIVKALKPENAIGGYAGPDFTDPATRRAQAAKAAADMGGVIAPTPTREDIAQRLSALPGMADIVQALQVGAAGIDKYAQHIIQGQDAISTHYVQATEAVMGYTNAMRDGAAAWRQDKAMRESSWAQEMSYGPGSSRVGRIGSTGILGGVLGFEDGGSVPGSTDTVPAMLTPGEYVSTVAATKTFYPVLEAMNRYAKGYAEGGAVTTNVGDINVTVRGGNSSTETVEEIGRGLRRALRRRTIRLD